MKAIMLTLAVCCLSAPAGVGQGAGLVGSTGLEPRVRVPGRVVGVPSALVIDRLVPSASPNLLVGISPEPDAIDLGPLGAPGGVIGIALEPSQGLFVQLPLMPVPATGEVALAFVVPAAWQGMTFYVQAAQLDAGAPVGGLALSDAEVVTFAGADPRVVASRGTTAASQDLGYAFIDGTEGPVLPALEGIEVLPVLQTAVHDAFPLDAGRPYRDVSEPGRPRIRFPDGASLYHYRDAQGRFGWFLVLEGGRRLTRLLDAPAIGGANPFLPAVAASPFEPLVAVAVDENAAALVGGSVFLMRVDGENHPGTASPVRAIPMTGTLQGYGLKEESMTFIQGALFTSDRARIVRIATLTGIPETVMLPPSAGLAPAVTDDELAWSRDGTTVAFGAGRSRDVKDIYLASATGPATNFTQSEGEYENVSYGDYVDGGRLALAPDASRVCYVKAVAGSPEVFVEDIVPAPPVPSHVTHNALFESTIDQEVTIHFFVSSRIAFTAGRTTNDHDAYAATVPLGGGPVTATNVTGTSGVSSPPYLALGTLEGEGFATVGRTGAVYLMRDRITQGRRLIQYDPSGVVVGDRGGLSGSIATQPTAAGGVAGIQTATGARLVRLDPAAGATDVVVGPVGTLVKTLGADPGRAGFAAVVTVGSFDVLVYVSPQNGVVVGPVTAGIAGGIAFLPGDVMVFGEVSLGQRVLSAFDPLGGTSVTLGPAAGAVAVY